MPDVSGDTFDDDQEIEVELDVENAENCIFRFLGEPIPSHVEDHRAIGHIPYRSWCSKCVRARWSGCQHRRKRDRREICVFSFNYFYFDKTGVPVPPEAVLEGAEVDLTILVVKDSLGKAVFAHVVHQKRH